MTAAMKKLVFAMMIATAGAIPARAATEADFKAAFAAADAAEKEAGRLRNQWLPTEAALAAAKKSAASGDFDQAMKSAQEAEALAKASVVQAPPRRSVGKIWRFDRMEFR